MGEWTKYIGVKIVNAVPMKCREATNKHSTGTAAMDDDGYEVTYPDGYKSWCPKGAFEAANRPCNAMPFGHAIEAARKGLNIAREGWNGKGMYVFLREGREIKDVDPTSPMGGDFTSLSHFCMRTADGACCVGWSASQADMLADDWMVV